MGMKQCSKCKEYKDEFEFSKDKTRNDGLDNKCKSCKIIYNDEYHLNLRKECFSLYGSKCKRCGEADTNKLSINHIYSPKEKIYDGLKRSGANLYLQLLRQPERRKYFTLLCMNCNQLDYLQKSGYYNKKTNYKTLWYRKKKEEICWLYNNKCMRCYKYFPTELLTINHVNGGGRQEGIHRYGRVRSMILCLKEEIINRLDNGDFELLCHSCNSSRTEYSKWCKEGKRKAKLKE